LTPKLIEEFKRDGVIYIDNFLGEHQEEFMRVVKEMVKEHMKAASEESGVSSPTFNPEDPKTWTKEIFLDNAKQGFFKRLYTTLPQVALTVDPILVAIVACLTGCMQLGANFYEVKIMPTKGTTAIKATGYFIHQDCCTTGYLICVDMVSA
jgi:hypothetical protein